MDITSPGQRHEINKEVSKIFGRSNVFAKYSRLRIFAGKVCTFPKRTHFAKLNFPQTFPALRYFHQNEDNNTYEWFPMV